MRGINHIPTRTKDATAYCLEPHDTCNRPINRTMRIANVMIIITIIISGVKRQVEIAVAGEDVVMASNATRVARTRRIYDAGGKSRLNCGMRRSRLNWPAR